MAKQGDCSWGSRPLQRFWLLQLLEALVVQTSSPSKWFNQDGSEHNLQEISCTVQEPPGWSVGCETSAALLFFFCNTNRHQIDHQTRRCAVFFTPCSPRLTAAYKKFTWNAAVWLCNFLKGGLLSSCFPLQKSQDPPFFFLYRNDFDRPKAPPRCFIVRTFTQTLLLRSSHSSSISLCWFTSSESNSAAAAADVSIKIIISACHEDVTWGLGIDFPLGLTFKVQYSWQPAALLLFLFFFFFSSSPFLEWEMAINLIYSLLSQAAVSKLKEHIFAPHSETKKRKKQQLLTNSIN